MFLSIIEKKKKYVSFFSSVFFCGFVCCYKIVDESGGRKKKKKKNLGKEGVGKEKRKREKKNQLEGRGRERGGSYGIPQHVQILQGMQNIRCSHRTQRPNLLNRNLIVPSLLHQNIHHRLCPISPIPQQSQITQRLLRAPQPPLALTQFITKGYK